MKPSGEALIFIVCNILVLSGTVVVQKELIDFRNLPSVLNPFQKKWITIIKQIINLMFKSILCIKIVGNTHKGRHIFLSTLCKFYRFLLISPQITVYNDQTSRYCAFVCWILFRNFLQGYSFCHQYITQVHFVSLVADVSLIIMAFVF